MTKTQSPFLQKKRVPCLRWGCPGDSSVSARARGTQSFCPRWKRRLQMPSPARPSSRPGGRPDGGVTRGPARPGSRKPRTQHPERERFRPRASTVPGRQCGRLALTPPQLPGAPPSSRNPCDGDAGGARTCGLPPGLRPAGEQPQAEGSQHRFTSETELPSAPPCPAWPRGGTGLDMARAWAENESLPPLDGRF